MLKVIIAVAEMDVHHVQYTVNVGLSYQVLKG